MDFGNQTVIVTGGTGALGRAVVGALLAAGARCRVPYVVDAEAAAFPHKDRVTLVGNCELTSEADVARLYDGVTDLWASIHIAGGFAMGSVDDTDKAGMMHMLNMNFVTCYLCSRGAVQGFGPGGGRIVNVAAPAGAGAADRRRHGVLCREQGGGRGVHPGAGSRGGGARDPGERDRAVDHRHAGQPGRDAEGGPRRLAQARGDRRDDRCSSPRRTTR